MENVVAGETAAASTTRAGGRFLEARSVNH